MPIDDLTNRTVEGFIIRKTLLYKTAVEYGDYTINHVLGCAHGCLYPCYAFLMSKRFGKTKSYEEWIKPKLVANSSEILKEEIPVYKNRIKTVHLCFTSDPFMYRYGDICSKSMELINILNNEEIACTALTKGLLPVELSGFSHDNSYGITLISLNESFREKIEPGAAPYCDRIRSLKVLHEKGCKTWVSIEPYPTPNIIEQELAPILNEIKFVDKIVFGRMNYNIKISKYKSSQSFYNIMSSQVIEFCKNMNIECHIKNGTIKDESEAV